MLTFITYIKDILKQVNTFCCEEMKFLYVIIKMCLFISSAHIINFFLIYIVLRVSYVKVTNVPSVT